MKKQILRQFASSAVVAAACLVFAGCAGGGAGHGVSSLTGTSTPAAGFGRAQITIKWPVRTTTANTTTVKSRLVPVAANSVLVEFLSSDGKNTVLASQVLARPLALPSSLPSVNPESEGGTPSPSPIPSTAAFTDLPQGSLLVRATAFPTYTGGDSVAQASATAPITIVAGVSTPIGLTMASTIATISISPDPDTSPNLFNGTPNATLTATAYDASNNIVLTDAFTWTDSNTDAISLSYEGAVATISAVSSGTATITVTETESQKSLAKTLRVGAVQ